MSGESSMLSTAQCSHSQSLVWEHSFRRGYGQREELSFISMSGDSVGEDTRTLLKLKV